MSHEFQPIERQPTLLCYAVPNMLTAASACCGLAAINVAINNRFQLAVALVLIATILDAADGFAARYLNSTSEVGRELDSLADFLSFGIAPAFLLYLWTLNNVQNFGWMLTSFFVLCSAFRLARFNVSSIKGDGSIWTKSYFTGMPAPAAAACVLLPMMIAFSFEGTWQEDWSVNAIFIFFIGLAMISKLPTFSLKAIPEKRLLKFIKMMILPLLFLLFYAPWITVTTIICIYVMSIPISLITAFFARSNELRK